MRYKSTRFLGALLTLALIAGMGGALPVAAQTGTPDDILEGVDPALRLNPLALARVFLDEGRPDLACALLKSAFGEETRNPAALSQLAECSNALGERKTAIAFAERGVALDPASTVLRAQLGALYMADGRTEAARRVFAGGQQASGGAEGSLLLSEIARQLPSADPALAVPEAKRWSIELYSGLVYDSNVNGGPASSTVAGVIGGVPLELILSDASRPKNSWGNVSTVNGSYFHPLSQNWALLLQGSLGMTTYFSEDDFSNDSGAASAALLYREGDLSVSIQPNARYVRQDRSMDETLYGVTARASLRLNDDWRATGSAGYARRNVNVDRNRDADLWLASAGAAYRIDARSEAGGEYLVQRNKAREDVNAYWQQGPFAYYTRVLTPELNVTASYRYSVSKYDERLALFAKARKDRQHAAGIGLDWNLSQWTVEGLSARAQYTYINTHSTVGLYEYDRHVVNTGLAFRF